MTNPLSAQSHPSHHLIHSIAPSLSLPIDMSGGAFSFAYRDAVGAVRSSLPLIGLCRLIAFPSRCYCPMVGSPCLSVVSGFTGIVLASPCPVLVVMPSAVRVSSHRLSPCSFDTGSGERSVLAACDSVFVSVRCGIITPRSRRGDMLLALCPVSSCPPVLVPYRIDWRGRLLGKTAGLFLVSSVAMWSSFRLCRCLSSSPNRSHISCSSRMYQLSPRHFSSAIGLAPPLVSNKTGSKTGRDFVLCSLSHRECECLRRWR